MAQQVRQLRRPGFGVHFDYQIVVFSQDNALEQPPPDRTEIELQSGCAIGDCRYGAEGAHGVACRLIVQLSREVAGGQALRSGVPSGEATAAAATGGSLIRPALR